MKKHPQNELKVMKAVHSGELEIDAEGRVWRVAKRTFDRWAGTTRTTRCKRVRAETQTPEGYMQVRMMRDKKRVHAAAHRLVWVASNGAIPQGMTVNHLNGKRSDNRVANLELSTYSEQRHHAIQVLGARHHDVRGERNPKRQATEKMVVEMRRRRVAGERVMDLAEEFGMNPKAVSAICNRRTWKHLP